MSIKSQLVPHRIPSKKRSVVELSKRALMRLTTTKATTTYGFGGRPRLVAPKKPTLPRLRFLEDDPTP